jgi:hypothetical protein
VRPIELSGGWRLRLLEEGEEMCGRMFPAPADAADVTTWGNELGDNERAEWRNSTATSADAHHAFLLAEEYAAAEAMRQTWVDQRPR